MHIDKDFAKGSVVVMPCSEVDVMSGDGCFLSISFTLVREASSYEFFSHDGSDGSGGT